MPAKQILIAATSSEGSITITAKRPYSIKVVGCSVLTSMDSANILHGCPVDTNSFSFAISKGQRALIAIHAYNKSTCNTWDEFVYASWIETEKPVVELEKVWVFPYPDRVGQIYSHDVPREHRDGPWSISTEIDGLHYTSASVADGDDPNNVHFRYVPNGGRFICQYLLGQLDQERIKAMVKEKEQEKKTGLQLKDLKKQLEVERKKVTMLKSSLEKNQKAMQLINEGVNRSIETISKLTGYITFIKRLREYVRVEKSKCKFWQIYKKKFLEEVSDHLPADGFEEFLEGIKKLTRTAMGTK